MRVCGAKSCGFSGSSKDSATFFREVENVAEELHWPVCQQWSEAEYGHKEKRERVKRWEWGGRKMETRRERKRKEGEG